MKEQFLSELFDKFDLNCSSIHQKYKEVGQIYKYSNIDLTTTTMKIQPKIRSSQNSFLPIQKSPLFNEKLVVLKASRVAGLEYQKKLALRVLVSLNA